jgi:hypothetical protein
VARRENQGAFDALLAGYLERFQPTDLVELDTVYTMVAAVWRQERYSKMLMQQPVNGKFFPNYADLTNSYLRSFKRLLDLRRTHPNRSPKPKPAEAEKSAEAGDLTPRSTLVM